MSGLAGPRNCTRPGPFEASLPIPVYPPQQFLVPLGPRASCLSIRPSCYVRLSTAFAETPIVPNSSVCFVLLRGPGPGLCDPSTAKKTSRLWPRKWNSETLDSRIEFEPNLPRAWLSPLPFNALTFTPWCVPCYTCLGKWSVTKDLSCRFLPEMEGDRRIEVG